MIFADNGGKVSAPSTISRSQEKNYVFTTYPTEEAKDSVFKVKRPLMNF